MMSRSEKALVGVILTVIIATGVFYFAYQPVGYIASVSDNMNVENQLGAGSVVLHAPSYKIDNVEVQVYKADGTWVATFDNHNLLTTTGLNFVRCYVGQGQSANSTCTPAIDIMVFNDSAYTPTVNDYKCDPATQAKVENSYGIGPQAGTYVAWSPATAGKFNVSATFTLSSTPSGAQTLYGACLTTSVTINATNSFAISTFSSTATLTAAGDYCKVIWTVTPS